MSVHVFRAALELNYPDVDVRGCMMIPQEFREKISKEWGPPTVRLATAKKVRPRSEVGNQLSVLQSL